MRRLVYKLPCLPYTVSPRTIVWTALGVAGARKARTMHQTHLRLHRAADLFLGGRPPAGQEDAFRRVQLLREAMLLVDKAGYAREPSDFAQLRRLAHELAPRLFDHWEDRGAAAHNFKAWRNLFEVDLVLLQSAHALRGGAVDTFHQHFKRGARGTAPRSIDRSTLVARARARRVPAEQPPAGPRGGAAGPRAAAREPDALDQRRAGAAPRRAAGRARAGPDLAAPRLAAGHEPRGRARAAPRAHARVLRCGAAPDCVAAANTARAGKRANRVMYNQFRHRCLCCNPACTPAPAGHLRDYTAERAWLRELVHWLVARRRLDVRLPQRRGLRGRDRRLADRQLHWLYRGPPEGDRSLVRRRAQLAAEHERSGIACLQQFGAKCCAEPGGGHVRLLRYIQLYQRRPDDGAVRVRRPGPSGFLLGKLFGGRRTCVLRLEAGLELRQGHFLRMLWSATRGGAALQADGTLPFVCGAPGPGRRARDPGPPAPRVPTGEVLEAATAADQAIIDRPYARHDARDRWWRPRFRRTGLRAAVPLAHVECLVEIQHVHRTPWSDARFQGRTAPEIARLVAGQVAAEDGEHPDDWCGLWYDDECHCVVRDGDLFFVHGSWDGLQVRAFSTCRFPVGARNPTTPGHTRV